MTDITRSWAIAEFGTDRIPIPYRGDYFELHVTDGAVYLSGERRLGGIETRRQLVDLVNRLRNPEQIDSFPLALGLWWLLE